MMLGIMKGKFEKKKIIKNKFCDYCSLNKVNECQSIMFLMFSVTKSKQSRFYLLIFWKFKKKKC